ncbi:MAG: hypothetical protein ACH350_03330 [Parachlamydiaceae bacterium]
MQFNPGETPLPSHPSNCDLSSSGPTVPDPDNFSVKPSENDKKNPVSSPRNARPTRPSFMRKEISLSNIFVSPAHTMRKRSSAPSIRTEWNETPDEETLQAPSPGKFTKISDIVPSLFTENLVVNEQMEVMGATLDAHAETSYEQQLDAAMKKAEKAEKSLTMELATKVSLKINEKIEKKIEASKHFFVTVDERKSLETPLQRIAAPFAYLTPSSDDAIKEGRAKFSSLLAVFAFDQHRENPEQYVSHGFDHSINVANYTRDVLATNPEIVESMSNKYKITEGEAHFLLENLALLHDVGYPCVGCRAKSVHGIAGADLISPMKDLFDKLIISPGVDTEKLFSDFRNAILFHSADKIESEFNAKIHTSMGSFLTDSAHIVQVLCNFYDRRKNPANEVRYPIEILVQNQEEKQKIEEALNESIPLFEEKMGKQGVLTLPTVSLSSEAFKGRFADLELNKDRLLGLEYSNTDLLENPLNIIRLVDNMDMQCTRLTPTQNQPAFQEIYKRLGDGQDISNVAKSLEDCERQEDKQKLKRQQNKQQLKNTDRGQSVLSRFSQNLIIDPADILQRFADNPSLKDDLEIAIQKKLLEINESQDQKLENLIESSRDGRELLNKLLIDAIFEKEEYLGLSPEIKEEIRLIGMQQSSRDYPHFGGTEAILSVKLVAIPALSLTGEEGKKKNIPCLVAQVDRTRFEALNQVKVEEEGVMVGIGEYQIWRASSAYNSIFVGNTKIWFRVVDEENQIVPCIVNS